MRERVKRGRRSNITMIEHTSMADSFIFGHRSLLFRSCVQDSLQAGHSKQPASYFDFDPVAEINPRVLCDVNRGLTNTTPNVNKPT
jgi:hypothetical protein